MKFKVKLLLLVLLTFSCTKLERFPNNGDTENIVFSDPIAYKQYLSKLYYSFTLTGQQQPAGQSDLTSSIDEGFSNFVRAYWKLQTLSTDEALNSWGDAGLADFQNRSWTDANQFIRAMYYRIFFISIFATDFIRQSSEERLDIYGINESFRPEIRSYRPEARFIRALSLWIALDLFRNIPLVTEIDGNPAPSQSTPSAVFNFIESELKEIIPLLPEPGQNKYGRANKASAQMLLAKLYLNSQVYVGQNRYTDCLAELNKIIAYNYYELAPKYDYLFYADNWKQEKEIILPFLQDGQGAQSWGGTTFLVAAELSDPTMQDNKKPDGSSFPGELLKLFGTGQAWSGNRPNEQLVDKFFATTSTTIPADTVDPRGLFWREGRVSKTITDPKNFGGLKEGYLSIKWKNINTDGSAGSNNTFSDIDFPMFRFADVYLMYAECVLRGASGGDAATALTYVNKLRERAWGSTFGNVSSGDLTLDFILDERQREMWWEGTRRTDLIRFGKFNTGYTWKWKGGIAEGIDAPTYQSIYPIPASELVANPNLKQNPGY